MQERCPLCNQWMPDVPANPAHARRERLVKEFTSGKKYRAYKGKFVNDPFEDFDMVLELEQEGLIERQTLSEEWKETVIFTWIGPK